MIGRFFCRNMSKVSKYSAGTQPFTVLVEGNIASGKTSFLNNFEHLRNDICIITEPVDKWRNVGNNNLLELMYKEPDRWALPFQTYVTLTMLQAHTSPTNKRLKLMERSIFSSRYCFVENMYKNRTIEEAMYLILNEWFKFIDTSIHIQSDLIVYLRTRPEVVYERMKKRARSEENLVPFEYLVQLHELHENWLLHRRVGDNTKVLVLDANVGLDLISKEYKRFENAIKDIDADEPPNSPGKIKIANTG